MATPSEAEGLGHRHPEVRVRIGLESGHASSVRGAPGPLGYSGCRATLSFPPRGTNGFGYDPIFVPAGHEQTFGELDADAKHAMSHRADAFRKLVAALL